MTVYDLLICPCCRKPLSQKSGSLVCEHGHTYDIAKSGYVNLINTSSQKESGDSKEMADARRAFLDSGAYCRFKDAIADAVGETAAVIDAGCGEGYYTADIAQRCKAALGFDLSKAAVMKAAKRAKAQGVADKTFFGVGSVFSMPVADGCADCVTSIFAPCAEDEFLRILKPGGILVVGCAGKRHLEGLKRELYDVVRENTERADLPTRMEKVDMINVSYSITLKGSEQIKNLYMMTPYCFKTAIEAQKHLLSLDTLETLVDFEIHVYRKK